MCVNPPKGCRYEMGNWRKSGRRKRMRLKISIDTADADTEQQDRNQEEERGAQDVGGF